MPPAPLPSSAFSRHALHRWHGGQQGARFPVTCAVYEEGQNLALYVTPVHLGALARSVELAPDDLALVLEGAPGVAPGSVHRWGELSSLDLEADLVHLPHGTATDAQLLDELPIPLLSSVEHALPVELGSRVAISVADGCHGVVIAREPALLGRCLSTLLDDYLAAVLGPEAPAGTFDSEVLEELLAPQAPGACFELTFTQRRRYWLLDARPQGSESEPGLRWVCERGGGRWRSWSWHGISETVHAV